MSSTLVVYLDGYAEDEQDILGLAGVETVRVGANEISVQNLGAQNRKVLIRGPKMTPTIYAELCRRLADLDTGIRTSSASYESLSSSEIYERSIQDYVPAMLTFSLSSPSLVGEIAGLIDWGQAFLRSELGSAAKSEGIESCFVRQFNQEEIREKLDKLQNAHPAATRVIARSVKLLIISISIKN